MLLLFIKKLMMNKIISQYIKIKNNTVSINGELFFSMPPDIDFSTFSKALYKHTGTKYLKFFKMDMLSKLGLISSEVLLKDQQLKEEYPTDKIGVVLSNSNSTIVVDQKYYQTVEDRDNYFPSPGLFVYTLPNIVIGEICIKNKFNGENNLFITKSYDPGFQINYISSLFEQQRVKACIGGWLDFTSDGYEAFMYLIEENEESGNIFNNENITKLYK